MTGRPQTVAVVVPCFNHARHLPSCVAGIRKQTRKPDEIIVVDDGSTDGSSEVAASLGADIVVVRQPNRGLSAARNAGIRRSTSEFVCIIDADDVLEPGCIERRLAILREHPEVALVGGYYQRIDASGERIKLQPQRRRPTLDLGFYEAAKSGQPSGGWVIRRAAFARAGYFDPLLNAGEDWDFLIRCARCFAVAYEPEVGFYYRQSSGSMSRDLVRMYDAGCRVLHKNAAYAPSLLRFRWSAMWGRYNVAVPLLGRTLRDRRGSAVRDALLLLSRRPSVMLLALLAPFERISAKVKGYS